MLLNCLSSTATLSRGFTWTSFDVTLFGLCPATLAHECLFARERFISAQLTCFHGSLRSSQTIHDRWRTVNPGRWTGDPTGDARSQFGGEMNTGQWTQPTAGVDSQSWWPRDPSLQHTSVNIMFWGGFTWYWICLRLWFTLNCSSPWLVIVWQ